MGYSTDFSGVLKFNRDLTHQEWLDLRKLADYDSKNDGTYERYTETPETIPDAYLQWTPTEDGSGFTNGMGGKSFTSTSDGCAG